MKKICLIGGGGHAKLVLSIIECIADDDPEIVIAGFLDDDPKKESLLGYKRIGSLCSIEELRKNPNFYFVLSIGDNNIRKRIASMYDLHWYTAIHPDASVSKHSSIGKGTVIMPGAIINPGVSIGEHVIINSGAIIEHDCRVSNFAHISPNATLCGAVFVGERSHIGAGATVIQCKKIGYNTVIGAGAVVVRDINDNVIAKGVPAK